MQNERVGLFDQWLSIIETTRSSRTFDFYSQVVREVTQVIGNPKEWGTKAVSDYLNWLRTKGNSDRSRNTKLQIVRSFVTWAKKRRKLPSHVVDSIPKKISYMPAPPVVATVEEVDKLIVALQPEPEALLAVLLMADAGLREGEVRSLQWENVKDNVIRVLGKGGKYREVPVLTDRLSTLLSEGLDKHPHDSYIVPGKTGGEVTRGVIGKRIRNGCIRAKIRPLNPHSFRHCFAIRSVKNNVATPLIQRALGHSSLETTSMYLRGLDGDLEALKEGYANFR